MGVWIIGGKDKSGAVPNIELEHHLIHEGGAFETDAYITLSGTTAQYMLVETNGSIVHWKEYSVVSEKNDILVTMFRAPIIDNKGTNTEACNCNELAIGKTPKARLYTGTTVSDEGTRICGSRKYIPGEELAGNRFAGGASSRSWERMLAPNSQYLVKVQRQSGSGNCKVLLNYYWYEPIRNIAGLGD